MNKKSIDQDKTTNKTAVISLFGAAYAMVNGLWQHQNIGDWLPIVLMGGGSAIAQWLQGTPTPLSQTIASVLRLNGTNNNAQLIRSAIDRLLSSGVVPGLSEPSSTASQRTVQQQTETIGRDMEQRISQRQRPQRQASQPMSRNEWRGWGVGDDRYPEIVQTDFDPNEIGPSTEAR